MLFSIAFMIPLLLYIWNLRYILLYIWNVICILIYIWNAFVCRKWRKDPHLFSLPMYFFTPFINFMIHLNYYLYYILLTIYIATYFWMLYVSVSQRPSAYNLRSSIVHQTVCRLLFFKKSVIIPFDSPI